jgi:hypothetical protein
MALTSAESYALRRAAISLGDNFGLHLYDKGSLAPLIAGTLALGGDDESPWGNELKQEPAAPNGDAPASPETGEKKPATRTRKPAAPVAEIPGEEPPAIPTSTRNMDDAFKKPTPKAAAS